MCYEEKSLHVCGHTTRKIAEYCRKATTKGWFFKKKVPCSNIKPIPEKGDAGGNLCPSCRDKNLQAQKLRKRQPEPQVPEGLQRRNAVKRPSNSGTVPGSPADRARYMNHQLQPRPSKRQPGHHSVSAATMPQHPRFIEHLDCHQIDRRKTENTGPTLNNSSDRNGQELHGRNITSSRHAKTTRNESSSRMHDHEKKPSSLHGKNEGLNDKIVEII
ncbi:hypothetical protein GQ53DRAFT_770326 [Thozetella sp. PMI_491]|nr:hypothetical protein GQ53DRAFT_770326 [Thozetella sp. PMI_491]